MTNYYKFTARTQKRIEKVSTEALKARESGITYVRAVIDNASQLGDREVAREMLAAMNYSVSQVQRELRNRRKK